MAVIQHVRGEKRIRITSLKIQREMSTKDMYILFLNFYTSQKILLGEAQFNSAKL